MEKTVPFTLEQVKQIAQTYPTPFHIYDEQAIRENARRLTAAFSWAPEFQEYFAVNDSFRQTDLAVDKLNMSNIVQIQHRAQFFRLDIFLLDIQFSFVNFGGGIGVPYRPEQEPVDLEAPRSGPGLYLKLIVSGKPIWLSINSI